MSSGLSWLQPFFAKKPKSNQLLPPELVMLIIQDSELADLYSFAMTCRYFQSICLPICLKRSGIDISTPTLFLQPSSFGRSLNALASSQILHGFQYKLIQCFLPSCRLDTEGCIGRLSILRRVISQMGGIEKLRVDINIAEMPSSSGTAMFPRAILRSHVRWHSEMTSLLYTAACKARCLHVCLSGYVTPILLEYLNLLPNPFSRPPGWGASDLKLEAMSFTNLETLPSSIAAHLVTVTSITSLRLSGALCASLGHLNLITLPNLLHFEVDGYRVPPTSHLCSFFSRHPSITTLQLDIGLSLWDSDTWPSGHESISPKYLPKASTLSADVASATWLLHNAKSLPSLENVTISAAYIGAKLIPDVQLHRRLWAGLASRAKSSLSNLTLRDTEVIGRLIVATSPFSAVPEEPLPSILILTLEGGRLNAPDSYPLHTSILNALPAWIAKLFPSLRKLDLMHMKLRVPAAIENAFVFSMNEQCPYAGVDHNIERLPHGAGP